LWSFSLLLATEHTANDGQAAGATTATFLLALLASKAERAGDAAETEATEQLVDTESTEQTIDKSTQSKTVEQLANQTQDTSQQKTDGSKDLEQRLGHQAPKRVELLLGVRHVIDALLCVVDGGDNGGGQLLQGIGQAVLLGSGLLGAGTALGLSSDATVGVETAQGAVALLQDATTLFNKRLDLVDQIFLVQLFTWGTVGGFDVL
jgi:hypothetical protein